MRGATARVARVFFAARRAVGGVTLYGLGGFGKVDGVDAAVDLGFDGEAAAERLDVGEDGGLDGPIACGWSPSDNRAHHQPPSSLQRVSLRTGAGLGLSF